MQSVLYHIIYEVRKPTEATSLSIQIYCQPLKVFTHRQNDFIYLCTQINVF